MLKKKKVYLYMLLIVVLVALLYLALTIFEVGDKLMGPSVAGDGDVPTVIGAIVGTGDEKFDKPMDVCVVDDRVYVTDTSNFRVQIFNTNGDFILNFGERGRGAGQFRFPYGITVDSSGKIYVSDMENGKISIFSSTGEYIEDFKAKGKETFNGPGAIEIIGEKLYIPEVATGAIYVYNLEGENLVTIPPTEVVEEKLNKPNYVTADGDGNIYVTDTGHGRVVVYDKDGKYLRFFTGSEDGGDKLLMTSPRGLFVKADGTVYVADKIGHEVVIFNKDGLKTGSFGTMGAGLGELYFPNGMTVGDNGVIYIVDFGNRVQMFR